MLQIKNAFQVGFNRHDSANTNIVLPLEGVQSLKMMTDSECREEPLKIIQLVIKLITLINIQYHTRLIF